MTQWIDYRTLAPESLQALLRLEHTVRESGLEPDLLELVRLRASYMNGCAYCVDMHTKDARARGESEQRLYAVPVWRETPFYSPRERAALAWAEVMTDMREGEVPDILRAKLEKEFTEKEIVHLTTALVAINCWNRLAVRLGADVGSYSVGDHETRPEARQDGRATA